MSRRPLLLLPLLALVSVLAACGSGSALSLDPVAQAATKTQDAQTFKVDFTAAMQLKGRSVSFSGNGAVDSAAGAASLSMDLSSVLPQAAGSTADFVFANTTMYMRLPTLAKVLPTGKSWVKVDLGKALAARGVDLGSLSSADPTQGLAQLQAAGDVQKVGTDTVQGEAMTHYKGVIDVTKAKSLTPKQKAAIVKALHGATGTIPFDAWVDSAGRLRRETTTIDYGKLLQGAQMTMTMDFSDFGTAVTVSAPPADQVVDLTSLIPTKS